MTIPVLRRLVVVGLLILAVTGCSALPSSRQPSGTVDEQDSSSATLEEELLARAISITYPNAFFPGPVMRQPEETSPETGQVVAAIRAVETSTSEVVLDPIQFLQGDEARLLEQKDGEMESPNGVYIRNRNPETFRLALSPDMVAVAPVGLGAGASDLRIIGETQGTPIVVMNREEFMQAATTWLKDPLEYGGAVFSLEEGQVVFVFCNYTP